MFKKFLIGIGAILLLLVVVGFLLPSKVHVERSTLINAPVSTVFALTNGFKGFNRWSPWHDRDPLTKYTYEGPEAGVGAKMTWISESPEVGKGLQEIVASKPGERIDVHLDFGDQGNAESFFNFKAEGDQTMVTWGFDTDLGMNLIGRYMGLMFDKWVGPDYEKGLGKLKELAESMPKVDFASLTPEKLDMEPIKIAYVSVETEPNAEAIGAAYGQAYGKIMAFLQTNSLQPAGMPISIDTKYTPEVYTFDAAFPVTSEPETIDETSEVKFGTTPSGTTLRFVHTGPYTGLMATYEKIQAYLKAYAWEMTDRSWAQFMNDPTQAPEAELVTNLYFPVK